MSKLKQSLIAALKEELSIINTLIEDAHELRTALGKRDHKTVNRLVAGRETAIMRLQMVQHAKTSILKKRSNVVVNKRNVKSLMLEMAPDSAGLLQDLQDSLVLLHQLNQVNDRILTKQRASVHSYDHLIDMTLGVEQTYDRRGAVSSRRAIHLEHQG